MMNLLNYLVANAVGVAAAGIAPCVAHFVAHCVVEKYDLSDDDAVVVAADNHGGLWKAGCCCRHYVDNRLAWLWSFSLM